MALSYIAKLAEITKNASILNHRNGHTAVDISFEPQANYPWWLLVDDLRVHPCTTVARSYTEGLAALLRDKYDGLLLDYRLDALGREPTGLQLLCEADDCGVLPNKVIITSGHPIGRTLLTDELKARGYQYVVERSDEKWFTSNGHWVRTGQDDAGKRKVTVRLGR